MTERDYAVEVVRTLRAAGHDALWAGGCVRDELMGHPPKDYDVATDARPERVQGLFRRTVAVGVSFGVVEVIGPRVGGEHLKVQVATFRSDGAYTDGRRPDSVTYSSAEEDARRRDFTINGMFFDPLAGRLIDHVGGRADLEAGVLRAIGEPRERFGLTVEPATAASVRDMADQIVVVSAERIADELRKLLTDRNRRRGVALMDDLGLLAPVVPELTAARHDGLAWPDDLAAFDALPTDAPFPLAAAALLFPAGPRAAARFAGRLKLSNADRDRLEWLVGHHADLFGADALKPHALKRLLAHAGAAELFALHRTVAAARGHDIGPVGRAEAAVRGWADRGELNPPPLVTGDDLAGLGLKPGPAFKRILDAARDAQLDGELADRGAALELAKRLGAADRRPAGPASGG